MRLDSNLRPEAACREASYTGDWDKLQEMLATGDEKSLFNGDLNGFVNNVRSFGGSETLMKTYLFKESLSSVSHLN